MRSSSRLIRELRQKAAGVGAAWACLLVLTMLMAPRAWGLDLTVTSWKQSRTHAEQLSNVPQPWVPTGAQAHLTAPCDPQQMELDWLESNLSMSQRLAWVNEWFTKCQAIWHRPAPLAQDDQAKLARLQYPFWQLSGVHAITFTLSNGQHLRGWLALKPQDQPRPLVIIKCPAFCALAHSPMAMAWLMHFYDEGPFHVLIVNSHWTTANAADNHRIHVGGLYEGKELLALAYWARFQSAFRTKLSGVHLLGLGLGGQAALYASLYNDMQRPNNDLKAFDSVMALCPAVGLKSALLEAPLSWKQKMNAWLGQAQTEVPDLQPLLAGITQASSPLDVVAKASVADWANTVTLDFSPLRPITLQNEWDFWNNNEFTKKAAHLQTPTLVWAAADDPVFSTVHQAQALKSWVSTHDKQSALQVLITPYGSHCASSVSYGWKVPAAIARAFFEKHSYDFWIKTRPRREVKVRFALPVLKENEFFVNEIWQLHPRSEQAALTFVIENDQGRRQVTQLLPLGQLPFGLTVPQNEAEAQMGTRWLNSHVEFYDDSDHPALHSRNIILLKWFAD